MHKFLTLALLALSLVTTPSFAEAPVASPAKVNPQTNKMKQCAAEYHQKNIAKSEYRKFMSVCLKKDYVMGSYASGMPMMAKKPAAPATAAAPTTAEPAATAAETAAPVKMTQREKMKQCNADAKTNGLKGQDRKDFMKSCLSAD